MKKLVVLAIVAMIAAAAIAAIAFGRHGDATGDRQQAPVAAQQNAPAPSATTKPSGGGAATPARTDAVQPQASGKGMAAIDHAAKAGKYLFVFFHNDESQASGALRTSFDAAMKQIARKAESVMVNATDPSEAAIVNRFGLSRAPMPLVLALAPNGAVTGVFRDNLDEQQLATALVSPCMAECLREMQRGRLVLLCVQNGRTKSNDAAMRGVRDFKSDARYANMTDVVTLDPADPAESKFLGQLKVDPKTKEAVTVFIAPPATAIATYTGATKKETLVAALTKARSTSGCGPNANPRCCPAPKK